MTNRETIFSPCRKYRYTLWRDGWDLFGLNSSKYAMFIGLNPSTADETLDDPTIRRCINFSKRWGYGAYVMTNLFAWRDTKPENMKRSAEPVGEENDRWISELAKDAGIIVCAWGKDGKFKSRDLAVMRLLEPFSSKTHALHINSDGTPKHPLYIPAIAEPKLFK